MTLLDIINTTIERMNNNEVYTEIIYPDGKAGMIQKAIEIELKRTAKQIKPQMDIIHPEDNTGLPDIYSQKYNKGIEVKVTLGWPTYYKKKTGERIKTSDDGCVVWQNGTVQSSNEYFLFIKASIKDNKLVSDNIWFGYMSYNDWHIHPTGGMRIRKNVVKKLCKQIL
jgi:hypothetical protein